MDKRTTSTMIFIAIALVIFFITQFTPVKYLLNKDNSASYLKMTRPVIDTPYCHLELKSWQDKESLSKIHYKIILTAKTGINAFGGKAYLFKFNDNEKNKTYAFVEFLGTDLMIKSGEKVEWNGILNYKNRMKLFDKSVFGVSCSINLRYPYEDKKMTSREIEIEAKKNPGKYTIKASALSEK